MTEYEAYKTFCAKVGGPVNEISFMSVFNELTDCVTNEWNKARKIGQHKAKHSAVVEHSLSLLLEWYAHGLDVALPTCPGDLQEWIASHQRAYCWAKALTHAHMTAAATTALDSLCK